MDLGALSNAKTIKRLAEKHGFLDCGISRAGFLEEEAANLESFLRANRHGSMQYLENHLDLRLDPTKLVPGAKTVVSLLYNYYPQNTQAAGVPKIARYAFGTDYHRVLRKKLKGLLAELRTEVGELEGRVFVDSAPIMERQWAAKSGLGWIGKNTLLLNKKHGSYFFLAQMVIDLVCEPDHPVTDHCGNCTACIDACPTDALLAGKQMDASRCISYFTIELKEATPMEFHSKLNDWVFGCDICQEVCPWNRFSKPHAEEAFMPMANNLELKSSDWLDMTEEVFKNRFESSAIKRAGLKKMKENVQFALKSQSNE